MKALVYTAPVTLEYREEPDPVPAAGEALVRIDAVGICGSDMHAWHGHDPRRVPPLILGHEAAGEVVSGSGIGRRVTMNPLIICGRCVYCLTGRSNLCENRTMIGMTRPGAYAQFVSIPEHCLVDLPADMNPSDAALTEPTATAWHAVDLAERACRRSLAECDALVIGGGAVGLLTALVLRARGIRTLVLAETNPLRRATAQDERIHCFDPTEAAPEERLADVVFDCVGSARTRQLAIHAARPGGVVVHIGLQDSSGELDVRKITLSELSFLGVYTYTTADLRASADALYRGVLGDLKWIERRPLDEGPAAFQDLDAGRSAAAKIVLLPQ
ncbi:MAG: alcohol dehydrogenase catalytic domain-containing protein [Rhodospirillales bacterium]|nr:MAG: alcohol dehydrogenase catalytic domain-containing protein [Rhodospirillales bacterium]